jgi:hypothetical protein
MNPAFLNVDEVDVLRIRLDCYRETQMPSLVETAKMMGISQSDATKLWLGAVRKLWEATKDSP